MGSKKTICLYNIDNLDDIRNEDIQFTIDNQLLIGILLTEIRVNAFHTLLLRKNTNLKRNGIRKRDYLSWAEWIRLIKV